jgi:hypothetical protein
MENITRTGYNNMLQTAMLLGAPYTWLPNSTLNERLTIQAKVYPASDVYPRLKYVCIGNGGHTMSVGADGVAAPDPTQHIGTNSGLFKPLPFVLREVTNDLTDAERVNYALRREETWNGRRYYAYYAKRIDTSNVVPKLEYIQVRDGVTTTEDFVPDSSDLNPVPQDLSPDGVNTTNGDYIATSAKLPLDFDANDMTELRNVGMVIYGEEKRAIISEIALCTGVDKQVSVTTGGNATVMFNEAIGVQISSFVSSFIQSKYQKSGEDVLLDIGATEPLFKLEAVATA